MNQSGIPDNVYRFLLENIDSLEQLEVLLLLRRERKPWNAAEVARELRIQPESAAHRLATLARSGILQPNGQDDRFVYGPRAATADRDVAGLAAAYSERRVTVINLIATKSVERIKSFADAFKIKGGS